MVDFRRWLVVLAVLALCAGIANAQLSGTGSGTTALTCSASSVPPLLRGEGFTELVGDILIQCFGGNIANNAAIPQVNITVSLNTQITSRLISVTGLTSPTGASEALLMIDDPGSNLAQVIPGFGPGAPQTFCTTPTLGCTEYAYYAAGQGTPVMVAAVGTTTATGAANIFQGAVTNVTSTSSGSLISNQVTFFGVPVLPPVSPGIVRQFRITNIRSNASALNTGQFGSVQVYASLSASPFTSMPLTFAPLVVGYVQPSLTTTVLKPGSTGTYGTTTGPATLTQCSTVTIGSTAAAVSFLSYAEKFPTAFKTRVVPLTDVIGAGQGTNTSGLTQNSPNGAYTGPPGVLANSESLFIFPTVNNGSYTAGLADFGTRLKAIFTNIPSGISLYVSVTNLAAGPGTLATAPAKIGGQAGGPYAVLVPSETSPEVAVNLATAPVGNFTAAGGTTNNVQQLAIVNGAAAAVWEVTNSNTNALDTLVFGVYVTYTANPNSNLPAPTSTTVNPNFVQMWYAPTPTGVNAVANWTGGAAAAAGASSSLPIPRFIDPLPGVQFVNINICQTALLWPYLVSGTSIRFETGLAISNTSTDPFPTATNQQGSCTLNWYGNFYNATTGAVVGPVVAASGTAQTLGCNKANAVAASCIPIIPTATTWVSTVGSLVTVAAANQYTGYMIAVCDFQWAHGYAAITDTNVQNFLGSYLALVLQGGTALTRGPAAESLAH